jgi:hypothetical protein
MVQTAKYNGALYKHSKLTEECIGAFFTFVPKPEQKRRSFDNNRKEWWLAKDKS